MNMEERVPIEAFAAERGIPASAVLSRIKSGIYSGVEEGGTWYVLRQKRAEELPVARPPNAPPVASPSEPVERITRITSRTFVRVLSVVLVVLIAVNFVTLVLGAWLSIVPIAVQAAVLLAPPPAVAPGADGRPGVGCRARCLWDRVPRRVGGSSRPVRSRRPDRVLRRRPVGGPAPTRDAGGAASPSMS